MLYRRVKRLLRHRLQEDRALRRALSPELLDQLERRVAASERRHRGEIRLYVEGGLPNGYIWREATPRERAIAVFGKLRVWDTEENNGVLIYVLLAEHAIEIVADRALARHVDEGRWREVVAHMRESFRAGRFEDGLTRALEEVSALLVQHFPAAPGAQDANELPNAPVVG